MKKHLILAIIVCIILFAGCATTSPQWACYKIGMTTDQFNRDNYECMQQSRTSYTGGGSGLIGLAMIAAAQANAQSQAENMYKMCMEARGYLVTK